MRRLLIRPGAIGDCIVSFPALEFLRAEYTEVWVPKPVVPLIQFADRVCSISSTGIDTMGIEGLPVPDLLTERLRSFRRSDLLVRHQSARVSVRHEQRLSALYLL